MRSTKLRVRSRRTIMPETERELVIKVVAMPRDTNAGGDMFGGWIVSQMDLAGAVHARKSTRSRIVTVAIDNLVFHKPVFVGDCVICYASTERIGTTSITIKVDVMVARRNGTDEEEQVTEGSFVYVAIGDDRKPIPLQPPV
ncbi:MAG: acyl-CoA thioesterase [Alphaproteobacteria bacterium]|nr:acyl-CoA thioesterase [Alphaproteobacteria bacterium]